MTCGYCGADISHRRSNARFCTDAHRVTYFQAGKQPRGRVKRTRRKDTTRPSPLWTPAPDSRWRPERLERGSDWTYVRGQGKDKMREHLECYR